MKTILLSLITGIIFCLNFSTAMAANVDFIPRISISETYTDNLNLDNSDEKEDFISTISPGFTLNIDARSRGIRLSYDTGYSFYNDYNEYNGWRHSANLAGWAYSSKRTRLEITDRFLYTEDPNDDEDEDNTIRTDRQIYYRNTAGVSLTHQFGEADSIALAYNYSILENDDDTEEDNSRYTPSANLTFWLVPRLWSLDTGVSYTRAEFTGSSQVEDLSDDFDQWTGSIRLTRVVNRDLSVFTTYKHTWLDYEGDEIDYQIYDPSLGLAYTWGKDARLSLSVGYYVQDKEAGDDESGLTLNGDIGKTWRSKRSSINLSGASGYEQSYYGAENLGFDIFYSAKVSATYELSRHFSGDAYASYRRDEYSETDDDRKDNTTRTGIGLSAQLTRWLSSRLGYAYKTVDSDEAEDEYTENRVILTFTLAPSSPI
jgi:hypothetical protein